MPGREGPHPGRKGPEPERLGGRDVKKGGELSSGKDGVKAEKKSTHVCGCLSVICTKLSCSHPPRAAGEGGVGPWREPPFKGRLTAELES